MVDKLLLFFGSELTLFSMVFFVLGCIVGSFLNVVIHRLHGHAVRCVPVRRRPHQR